MVKIPRNKLEDGGHRDEKGLGQKRRRMTTEDRSAWRGNSNVGTPMRANHGDNYGFGMTNSEDDDEDSEATASRDGTIRYDLENFRNYRGIDLQCWISSSSI